MTKQQTSIEQQTQKRRGTGLTAYDPERVFHGYTLFTTLSGDGIVYLIDIVGNVVHQFVSFRGISNVVIISKNTGNIVWRLGHDVLAQQHDPTFLENGNILIFDNGTQRLSDPHTYSRVIEVNPKTNEIVWEYRDTPAYNFYSAFISGAQRLTNGNTLITEGLTGRIFEVTSEGEVIWEYVNPYFSDLLNANRDNAIPADVYAYYGGASMNSIFRAFRYAPDEIPQLKQ